MPLARIPDLNPRVYLIKKSLTLVDDVARTWRRGGIAGMLIRSFVGSPACRTCTAGCTKQVACHRMRVVLRGRRYSIEWWRLTALALHRLEQARLRRILWPSVCTTLCPTNQSDSIALKVQVMVVFSSCRTTTLPCICHVHSASSLTELVALLSQDRPAPCD